MDINGVIRVNMTGAEIEEALMKARDLPTNTELTQILNEMQTAISERLDRIIKKTYDEMVALRDAAELVPGQLYRITDYVTTTMVEHTQSAGHPFDIVVLAMSPNTLSEAAMAMVHEGDEYFDNEDTSAFQLKYTLDNIEHSSQYGKIMVSNQYRFDLFSGPVIVEGKTYYVYACPDYPTQIVATEGKPTIGGYFAEIDITQLPNIVITNPHAGVIDYLTPSGKGTVTYMKNGNNCEANFDFYNIEFKRWKVTDDLHRSEINGKYLGILGQLPNHLTIEDESDFEWKVAIPVDVHTRNISTNLSVENNTILGTNSHDCIIHGEWKNCTLDLVENSVIDGVMNRVVVGNTIIRSTVMGNWNKVSVDMNIDCSTLKCEFNGVDFDGRTLPHGSADILSSSIHGDYSSVLFHRVAYSIIQTYSDSCTIDNCSFSSIIGHFRNTNIQEATYNTNIVGVNVNLDDASGLTLALAHGVTVAKDSNGVVKIWNPADLVQ